MLEFRVIVRVRRDDRALRKSAGFYGERDGESRSSSTLVYVEALVSRCGLVGCLTARLPCFLCGTFRV